MFRLARCGFRYLWRRRAWRQPPNEIRRIRRLKKDTSRRVTAAYKTEKHHICALPYSKDGIMDGAASKREEFVPPNPNALQRKSVWSYCCKSVGMCKDDAAKSFSDKLGCGVAKPPCDWIIAYTIWDTPAIQHSWPVRALVGITNGFMKPPHEETPSISDGFMLYETWGSTSWFPRQA